MLHDSIEQVNQNTGFEAQQTPLREADFTDLIVTLQTFFSEEW